MKPPSMTRSWALTPVLVRRNSAAWATSVHRYQPADSLPVCPFRNGKIMDVPAAAMGGGNFGYSMISGVWLR
jgi:hypothetical protein